MKHFALFIAGALFAGGLALSGMTQPQKVLGFLDFAGHWDPALMFVMVGAIGVNFVLLRLTLRRAAPVFAPRFQIPTRTDIDLRLLGGAALFGVGWGTAGLCPGPALGSLIGGTKAVAFIAAMALGMRAFDFVRTRRDAVLSARAAAELEAERRATGAREGRPSLADACLRLANR